MTKEKADKDCTAKKNKLNECPVKDKDGNCLKPGSYRDSEPIGGG